MAVYVDDVQHRYERNLPTGARFYLMCHLWADTEAELLGMVDAIGVARRYVQKPPKATWLHFDIAKSKKRLAILAGAILTDKYGPVEHVARLANNIATLNRIARCRARPDYRPPVNPWAAETKPAPIEERQGSLL